MQGNKDHNETLSHIRYNEKIIEPSEHLRDLESLRVNAGDIIVWIDVKR